MKRIILSFFLMGHALNLFPQTYIFDSIPDNLKNRADAVVRSDQCLFTIIKPGNAIKKVKKAITLLNEDSRISYKYLKVFYDNYSRINYFRGTIYDEKGNIIKALGIENIEDMSAMSGGTFYSDDRMKVMYFPIYKLPYTIEYEYEITYSGLMQYPKWKFQESSEISVQKSRIQFVVPENMKLRYYGEFLNNKVDSVILDGRKIYTWHEENLPAYQSQNYSIRRIYYTPTLYTAPLDFNFGGFEGSMRSWNDFGKWFFEINKDRDDLPQTEIDAITKIVSGTVDPKEKVRLIYEYMQSKTRYVSIQIGIGGYRTEKAEIVAKNGYGDCKALVNYTSSLLEAVGIKSYTTLINAGTIFDINTSFVSNCFDHVILCVPVAGDTIWLECTSQTNPFNYLASGTAGKHVLIISPEGGKLAKTPGFEKYQNIEKRTGLFNMNILGSSSGKVLDYYSGSYYAYASGRYLFKSEEDIQHSLYSELRYSDLNISSVAYSETKSSNPSSQLSYEFNIKNFATVNGEMIYFCPTISEQAYLQNIPEHLRIPVNEKTSDSLTYNLPLNYKIEYLPENVRIENEFGKYIYSLEISENKVILKRIFELNALDIPTEKYDKFRMFINEIAKADREKIILTKSNT